MKQYIQFTITTKPHSPELISGLMWELEIDGVNDNDINITVFAREATSITIGDIEKLLNPLVEDKLIENFSVSVDKFEDKNWNEEWEKTVDVVEISDRIVIKPTFREYQQKPGQVIIQIDPKMSFGTGNHETTKLVLQMIEKHVSGGEKVLDVGTGTGVLAIASVMFGAANAIGIDNDEWCLLNGQENTALNKLDAKVEIRLAETKDIPEKNFDLIVANINKHILLEIHNDLKEKLNLKGKLILSGLLDVDEADILNCYSNLGYHVIERKQINEWITLVMKLN